MRAAGWSASRIRSARSMAVRASLYASGHRSCSPRLSAQPGSGDHRGWVVGAQKAFLPRHGAPQLGLAGGEVAESMQR